MPAYDLQWVESLEENQNLYKQMEQEVDACTEVRVNIRTRIKRFLKEQGIQHISELDYPLRETYEAYLMENETILPHVSCLSSFDKIKIHSMREEMQTLAGRRKYSLTYTNQILFLLYYPQLEIAEGFKMSRNKQELVWDFSIAASEHVKRQIFDVLNELLRLLPAGWWRKVRLLALRYLYEFCIREDIQDIEAMELEDEIRFKEFLLPHMTTKRNLQETMAIVEYSRKILFLQSKEIHWEANVWYLDRFHFSKERLNPSNPVKSISFTEIKEKENKELLKKFTRYLLGVTDLSISTILRKFMVIRTFLAYFDETEKNVIGLNAVDIDAYLKRSRVIECLDKTFNMYVFDLLQFYKFLLVKGYIKKIPFHPEYYLKRVVDVHHDRSVSDEVCEEIVSKLKYFPEHLRLMFLHLWCIGLRCSEVCTLNGDAYEWKNDDTWIKVYQIKAKTYKRIPIPKALYRLMEIYIRKNKITSQEYIFQNKAGGAYYYQTFRTQMLKYCRELNIANGEYLFQSHGFRHGVATQFYDSGISIQAVRDYLGHDYESMTRQYVDFMPKKLEKANEEYFSNPEFSLGAEFMKGDSYGK
ncbi:tyrosine-type recombinase/integrase [Blautia producta]|uniref:tyrosine-type recombinase/integrase n=1 Tax=Blautia producta TaxID=33035 RepID=UPI0031B576FF